MEDQELHFKQPEEEKKRSRSFFARLGGAALAAAILASPTTVEAATNKNPVQTTYTDAFGNPLMPGSIYIDPVTGLPTLVPLPTVTPNTPTPTPTPTPKLGINPSLEIPLSTPTPTPTPTPSPTPIPSPTQEPIVPNPVVPDPVIPDPIEPDPIEPDPLAPEPGPEQPSLGINPMLDIPTTPEVPMIDPLLGTPIDDPLTPPVDPEKALMDSLITNPENLDVEAEDFPTDILETEDEEEELPAGPVGPNGELLTPEEIPIFAYKWEGQKLDSYLGHVDGPTGDETYYNLPMGGVVKIMRKMGNNDEYWVREDGVKMLGKYIMCAADLRVHPRGSIVQTTLGPARVCDTGTFAKTHHQRLDIAVNW